MQGELLSPILFSLNVNDFETEFLKQDNRAVELQELNLNADDMDILAEFVLKLMLNTMNAYSSH